MFSRIEGLLREKTPTSALVEAGGLCYDIMLPRCVADKLSGLNAGDPIKLEIFSYLQIDGNRGSSMYVGFTNAIEREFFEALLTVASIGPKTAARAFSQPMAQIARYIDAGDLASLRRLPGIGEQKAKDIIAKLQGKVARFGLIQGEKEAKKPEATPDFVAEAVEVLLQLQYRRAEADRMAREALANNGKITTAEDLLTEIYRRQQPAARAARSEGSKD
ncbi:MAG TPA: Holliday junction branch migration protein RuvA [Candidatus Eremiobacteraceae bacterium]|nr:Holliday junction branch migration protein RuvA [Candidatus Eremiobacteraceae bacterium]